MNVCVLIDNNPHPELNLVTEHGLSIYFEVDGLKWLYDIGASANYYVNAEKMGIAIEEVDFLIISHGHADHSGGLEHFLTINPKAQIVLSRYILGKHFYSYRRNYKKDISTNTGLIEKNKARFTLADTDITLSPNVTLLTKIPQTHTAPKGNNKLYVANTEQEELDSFTHEIILTVRTPKGIVVFSGCSHHGVLNILEASSDYHKNDKIIACIGGTHLIDSDTTNTYETDKEITEIGESILKQYPSMQLITGHCTGKQAHRQLANILKEKLKVFYSGATYSFGIKALK